MYACVLVVWVRAVSRLEQALGGVARQSRGWLAASAAKHGNHVVDHSTLRAFRHADWTFR